MTDATFCLNFSFAACSFSRMASNMSHFVATAFRCSWMCFLRNAADFLADIVSSSACSSAVLRLNHAEIDLLRFNIWTVEWWNRLQLLRLKSEKSKSAKQFSATRLVICECASLVRSCGSWMLWYLPFGSGKKSANCLLVTVNMAAHIFSRTRFTAAFCSSPTASRDCKMAALWGKFMPVKTAGQFAWRTGVASCRH